MAIVFVDAAAKWCKWCKQAKPRTEFHKNDTYKDRLTSRCKKCASKQAADYYIKNKGRICELPEGSQ